jgi:hypothetical protein
MSGRDDVIFTSLHFTSLHFVTFGHEIYKDLILNLDIVAKLAVNKTENKF